MFLNHIYIIYIVNVRITTNAPITVTKNEQIAETMRKTYEKRRSQRCRVFELKVKRNRLNNEQKHTLHMMFVEAKWCYNYILSKMNDGSVDIFSFKGKQLSEITHRDMDGNDIPVRLSYITSSLKDGLVERMRSQIKTLAALKRRGRKVGALKFVSDYTSINLKQFGITHKIVSHNRIRVQGVKKPLPVSGLDQLDRYGARYDIANAVLRRRDDDYYINLTVYYDKDDNEHSYSNEIIGVDMGCETSLTLSDGRKIDCVVEETEKLKRLTRRRMRTTRHSNNHRRLTARIHREYDRIGHLKDDAANKVVHMLLSENRTVVIQDEQITSWKRRHGKKVQHGILGRVKQRLMEHPDRVCVINRFVPTTKFCRDCGHMHSGIALWDRVYVCPECGAEYDRDVHAAGNMVWLYENMRKYIGPDGSDFKRAEFDEEVCRLFGRWSSRTAKHEDAKPLA